MKKWILLTSALFLFACTASKPATTNNQPSSQEPQTMRDKVKAKIEEKNKKKLQIENPVPTSHLKIESPAFNDTEKIPAKFTCDGENVSPPLKISGVPEGTKSLILIVSDPSAPNGKFVHWMVWNIDPSTTEIPENTVPSGAFQGISDFQKESYGGPCPGKTTHPYLFELWAVDKTLPKIKEWTAGHVLINVTGHMLGKASLEGEYGQ